MQKKVEKIMGQISFTYVLFFLGILIAPLLPFVLTRGLSVEEYGAYALFYSLIMFCILFLQMGLNAFLVKKIPHEPYKKRMEALFSVIILVGSVLVVFTLLGVMPFVRDFFLALTNLQKFSSVYYFVLAMIIIGVINHVFYSFFYAQKKITLANSLHFLTVNLWIIATAVVFFLFGKIDLKTVFLIGIFSYALVFLVTMKRFFKELESSSVLCFIKKQSVKNAFFFGLPLIPYVVLNYFIPAGSRFIMSAMKGPQSVALFALPYSILAIVFTLSSIATGILFPYIVEETKKKKGNEQLLHNAVIKAGLLLVLPAMAGVFILRYAIVTLISGQEYLQSANIIPILMFFPLFSFFSLVFYQNAIAHGKVKHIGVIYTLCACLNVVLNYVLIRKYSLYGAAFATIVTYASIAILLYLSARTITFDYKYLKLERILLACIIMAVFLYFLNPLTYVAKILAIVSGMVMYAISIIFLRVFTPDEISLLKRLFFRAKNFVFRS